MIRVRTIFLAIICAAVHFGLTLLAVSNGFLLFRGPSTANEIFWNYAMQVLLFPAFFLFRIVDNSDFQIILAIFNILLWGTIVAFLFLNWRKFRTR